jgi:hypothetical protein
MPLGGRGKAWVWGRRGRPAGFACLGGREDILKVRELSALQDGWLRIILPTR